MVFLKGMLKGEGLDKPEGVGFEDRLILPSPPRGDRTDLTLAQSLAMQRVLEIRFTVEPRTLWS